MKRPFTPLWRDMIGDVEEGTKFTLIDQAMNLVGPTYGVDGIET